MLRDINSSDPLHLKYIIKKIKDMAQGSPYLVMETIHDYFADNPQISNRHKFRLFQVLKNVIGASDVMEDIWKRRFMQLALENMTKSTELEDVYQNAASDVLVALCRHSWPEVAQHLETEFLTGVFPHRSVLYVMGTLSSHEELLNREDRARWENLLAQVAAKSVPFLNTDMWSRELLSALTTPSRTQQEELPEKDETLKQSFLTANLMLMGAISRNEGAHSYEFSQISELLECLMVLMEKEPQDALCTESRPQALHIISSLCKLRPPMDTHRKSRLLSTCLRSVFALPLLDALEKHTCLFLEPPNIQTLYSQTTEALDCMLQSFITQSPTAEELHFLLSHLYVWLASEKAHERQRAVHSCVTLLKFLNHKRCLDPKEGLKRIGQLVGMLGILCQDPDGAIQRSSLEGVGHLYQLLIRQKGETFQVESLTSKEFSQPGAEGAPLWSSEQKVTSPDPQELASPTDSIFHLESSQALKEIMRHLLMAEVTDLIWTAISGLGSSSPFRVQAAAELLLAVIHQHGAKLETVANMGRGIHLRLCSVRIPQAKDNALSAITLLARNHTPELVAAFLDFSMPLDRRSLPALPRTPSSHHSLSSEAGFPPTAFGPWIWRWLGSLLHGCSSPQSPSSASHILSSYHLPPIHHTPPWAMLTPPGCSSQTGTPSCETPAVTLGFCSSLPDFCPGLPLLAILPSILPQLPLPWSWPRLGRHQFQDFLPLTPFFPLPPLWLLPWVPNKPPPFRSCSCHCAHLSQPLSWLTLLPDAVPPPSIPSLPAHTQALPSAAHLAALSATHAGASRGEVTSSQHPAVLSGKIAGAHVQAPLGCVSATSRLIAS